MPFCRSPRLGLPPTTILLSVDSSICSAKSGPSSGPERPWSINAIFASRQLPRFRKAAVRRYEPRQHGRNQADGFDRLPGLVGKVLVPDAEAKMVPLRTLAAVASRKTRNRKELDLLARGIAYAAHSASAVVSCAAVIVDGAISAENLRHVIASLRGHMGELGEINAAPPPYTRRLAWTSGGGPRGGLPAACGSLLPRAPVAWRRTQPQTL